MALLELSVSPDDPRYRRGFCDGFQAPRDARPDPSATWAYRVGWTHGAAGCQIPPEMFWRDG